MQYCSSKVRNTTTLRGEPVKHPTVFAGMMGFLIFDSVLGTFENDTVVQFIALSLPKLHHLRNYPVTVPARIKIKSTLHTPN